MPKKRRESAFGIHFDFHAMPGDTVPSIWKPEYYAQMLDAVKPDYVQCDTKGHAGLSSYPTDAGNRADIKTDILKMMREETAKRGIALYGHHSGLYDQKAAADHPEWAVVGADGTVSRDYLSVFGPFVDLLLIPQLRELAGTYKLDGAWIDGECWATQVDYSSHAVNAYKSEFGTEPPRPGEAGYAQYREFCRTGFKKYVKHYVEVIKKEFPSFEITSNWIFSAQVPERMDVDVDFLSGDYAPVNSVESARFQGRVLEARNVPWDLMAWGQNAIPFSWLTRNRHTKELIQYCQEASVIVAMGGGFEFFNIHYASGGAIQQWAIPVWSKTADFCRQRSVCFGGRIVPEFGILMPNDRNREDNPFLYTECPAEKRCDMWVSAMQDCQFSTKVILEDQIVDNKLDGFKIIAVPGTSLLDREAAANLEKFVSGGGIVIVDNPAVQHFTDNVPAAQLRQIFIDADGALASAESNYCDFSPENTAPYGEVRFDNIYDVEPHPAAFVRKQGKGAFCFLAFDLGDFYTINRSNTLRVFLKKLISDLGFSPDISVSGTSFADLTVTRKDNSIIINLINMAGAHNVPSVRSYNEIPPVGPVTVKIAPELKIKEVTAVPDTLYSTEQTNGVITSITLQSLHIHAAFVCK